MALSIGEICESTNKPGVRLKLLEAMVDDYLVSNYEGSLITYKIPLMPVIDVDVLDELIDLYTEAGWNLVRYQYVHRKGYFLVLSM